MATIFQKVAGEQCLILGSREALIYPFDVGSWSEIRVGYYISLTSASDDNALSTNETSSYAGSFKNSMYWGLKDSGSALPTQAAVAFVGWGQTSTQARTSRIVNHDPVFDGNPYVMLEVGDNVSLFVQSPSRMISYGTAHVHSQANVGDGQFMITPVPANGTGTAVGYAAYYTEQYIKTNVGGKNTISFGTAASLPAEAHNITNLRNRILASSYTTMLTGWATTDQTSAGTNLDLNSLFIYMPFVSNRLRIHAIVIEKVA